MNDSSKTLHLGLWALELAVVRVKRACRGEDLEAAAVEAQFGTHAVYDLHEALFRPLGLERIAEQDRFYAEAGGEVVGGLVVARGAQTHRLVRLTRVGGFGDLPHGMGPYGPGWFWVEHSWPDLKFQTRARWYDANVRWRLLRQPLDLARAWFISQVPKVETN